MVSDMSPLKRITTHRLRTTGLETPAILRGQAPLNSLCCLMFRLRWLREYLCIISMFQPARKKETHTVFLKECSRKL